MKLPEEVMKQIVIATAFEQGARYQNQPRAQALQKPLPA